MRIAALDLGTNSFHLLVAEVSPDGSIVPIVREKEMLRLGDVVSAQGFLGPEDIDRAVASVRRMRLLAEGADATEFHARATSAIRVADNGAELVDRIHAEAGIDVEVISGLTEARLIFGAIRASVVLEPAPALCFDLGGGSLEVMVGDAGGLAFATSVNLGVGRLTSELISNDPPTKSERNAVRQRILNVLEPVAAEVGRYGPELAVGSSGTLEALARMTVARATGSLPTRLNQITFGGEALAEIHSEIWSSNANKRRKMAGLDARRADLIPAGSMVLVTAMELFGLHEMTISEWALREGIVLDAVRHHDPEDWSDDPRAIRRASVIGLARRCNSPVEHSTLVTRLALELFDGTRELHSLGSDERELLEYGALLHDIGELVSTDGHHKHSAYLVRHGRLRGFSPREITMLAALVRWHRRGDPKRSEEFFGALDASDRDTVRALAAILRVADGLDRGKSHIVDGLDVRVTNDLVLVRVRASADPELEIWGARRKRDLFESVFDRELEITTHPAAGPDPD